MFSKVTKLITIRTTRVQLYDLYSRHIVNWIQMRKVGKICFLLVFLIGFYPILCCFELVQVAYLLGNNRTGFDGLWSGVQFSCTCMLLIDTPIFTQGLIREWPFGIYRGGRRLPMKQTFFPGIPENPCQCLLMSNILLDSN